MHRVPLIAVCCIGGTEDGGSLPSDGCRTEGPPLTSSLFSRHLRQYTTHISSVYKKTYFQAAATVSRLLLLRRPPIFLLRALNASLLDYRVFRYVFFFSKIIQIVDVFFCPNRTNCWCVVLCPKCWMPFWTTLIRPSSTSFNTQTPIRYSDLETISAHAHIPHIQHVVYADLENISAYICGYPQRIWAYPHIPRNP